MFQEFNEQALSLGFRGWRLDTCEGALYLSKYDDHYNDDELRFFIQFQEGGPALISRMERLKTTSSKVVRIHPHNEHIRTAHTLLRLMAPLLQRLAPVYQ